MTEVLPPPGDDLGASRTSPAPAGPPLAPRPSPNGSSTPDGGGGEPLVVAPMTADPPPTAPTGAIGSMRVRPGDIVIAWRLMLTMAWCGAFFAYAAVWQASVQIGIGTWWLGPRSEPTPPLVRLIPFAIVLVVIALLGFNARRPLAISLLGTIALVLVAIPDFTRSVGLALAELTIPIALLAVTLAALTGRYRLVEATGPSRSPATAPPDAASPVPEASDSVSAP